MAALEPFRRTDDFSKITDETHTSLEVAGQTLSLSPKDIIRLALAPTAYPWCIAEILHITFLTAMGLYRKALNGTALRDQKQLKNNVEIWRDDFVRYILIRGLLEIPEVTEEAFHEMIEFHDELVTRSNDKVHPQWKIEIANHKLWIQEEYERLKAQLKNPRVSSPNHPPTKLLC